MKRKFIEIIKCIICTGAFFVLLILSWRFMSNRLEVKKSHVKYDAFLEGGYGEDVLFLGSSHMINAVFPDQLWEEYGITSYNLANHGELLPTSYEVFRNALDYSSPKVVVVDVFTVALSDTYYNKSFSHISLDAFPLTWTKFKSINALFGDIDTKCEFISNFCLYHTRWDNYLNISPVYTPSAMMGAEMRVNVESSVGSLVETNAIDETMTDGIAALLQFKQLCDERGIQLVCVNIPYSGFEERDAATNYAGKLLEEANITYLDFRKNDSDLILDPKTDFYDTQHVNPLGGSKVTTYLGQYLIQNCGVQDRRSSEYAVKWNTDTVVSSTERMNELKNQVENGDILNTLMMMKANGTRGIIVITPYVYFRDQDIVNDLLQQMGFDVSGLAELTLSTAWVGIYDEENNIAACQIVNGESSYTSINFPTEYAPFCLNYDGNNSFVCSYGEEGEMNLHNQMFAIYLFDDNGSLFVGSGFGID